LSKYSGGNAKSSTRFVFQYTCFVLGFAVLLPVRLVNAACSRKGINNDKRDIERNIASPYP
jgi:hypothetical protein